MLSLCSVSPVFLPWDNPCLCLVKGCFLKEDKIMHWVDGLILELERSETCDSGFCEIEGISDICAFHCFLPAVIHVKRPFCASAPPLSQGIAAQLVTHLLAPMFWVLSLFWVLTDSQLCVNHTVFTTTLACSLTWSFLKVSRCNNHFIPSHFFPLMLTSCAYTWAWVMVMWCLIVSILFSRRCVRVLKIIFVPESYDVATSGFSNFPTLLYPQPWVNYCFHSLLIKNFPNSSMLSNIPK